MFLVSIKNQSRINSSSFKWVSKDILIDIVVYLLNKNYLLKGLTLMKNVKCASQCYSCNGEQCTETVIDYCGSEKGTCQVIN
jgi:hypothetical protein